MQFIPCVGHVGLSNQATVPPRVRIEVHDPDRVRASIFDGLMSATYASFSRGDCTAIVGEG
jgi:hypothetical protein